LPKSRVEKSSLSGAKPGILLAAFGTTKSRALLQDRLESP
jgi:hypothetical protein